MSPFWQDFLKHLGSVTVISAVLAFLIRSIIVHLLSRDVEAYKSRLKSATDREIESFKTELAILAKERDIRFSKLHEKRVESIAKLYNLLGEAHGNTIFLSAMIAVQIQLKDIESFASDVAKEWWEFRRFYESNKLYFPKQLSDQLDSVINPSC